MLSKVSLPWNGVACWISASTLSTSPAGVVPRRDAHGVQARDILAYVREPLLLVGQRDPGGDKGDAARAANDARRVAGGVLLDRAAARVRRRRVYPRRLERGAVQVAVDVDRLEHHRVVRRDAVELLERKAARLVGELVLGPAAERHDPLAGARAAHPLSEHRQG